MQSLPASQQKEWELQSLSQAKGRDQHLGISMGKWWGLGGCTIQNATWGLAPGWNVRESWDLNKRQQRPARWEVGRPDHWPKEEERHQSRAPGTKSESIPPKTTTLKTYSSVVFEFHLRKFRVIQGLTFSKPQRQPINHKAGISERGQVTPTY